MKQTIVLVLFFVLSNISFSFSQNKSSFSGEPEKLNLSINSPSHESHPVISPDDGSVLYFSRWKHPQNIGGIRGGRDIWFSKKDSIGNWSVAENLGFPLNNKGHNHLCGILPDGNTLLLPNRYNSNGDPSNTPGISISRKTPAGWSLPEGIDIEFYTNKSEQGDFFLSADGKTMLMAIEYYFTYGNEDLHVSFLQENGKWSQPKNLGQKINTKFHELSPYLSPDGVSLYFSSNGHGGFGSKDIFLTKRLDDTWQNWATPVNLGESINSAGMESSFVVPASGEFGYLVTSTNSDGNSDIYRVPIPKNVQPEAVVLIHGKIINAKTNRPVQAKITYELLPEGNNLGIATSDPLTGEYKIILPGGGKKYGFYAESNGYLSTSESLDASNLNDYREIKKDLYLTPLEIGESITLQNVFFVKSKSAIINESFPELDRLVKLLKDNPTIEIEISGHTDNQGPALLNQQLSEQRVERVKEYIISKGIIADRVKGKGYGSTQPIAPNDSEENRKKNRRVEFRILKK